MNKIQEVASLIRRRNEIDQQIAGLIGRPANPGHLGEWIAQEVFDISLEESAVQKGFDGRFSEGSLAGKTVNVKCYGKREGLLDINPDGVPDFYLVMTGPKSVAASSRGGTRPLVISDVFLFDGPALVGRLSENGVKLGIATSVRQNEWGAAKIYPDPAPNALLHLTREHHIQLDLFAPSRL